MFGISFSEFLVLGTVALLVLGPEKLPGLLRTLGKWLAKLRKLTSEVRSQSGIDDVLRSEGFDGGLHELRSLMRGGLGSTVFAQHAPQLPTSAPAHDHFAPDKSREYPAEGADSYGALPEDLVPGFEPTVASAPEPGGPHPVLPTLPTPAVPTLPNAAVLALPDAAAPQPAATPALSEQPAEPDANQPASTPPEGPG